jgi:hypothetical protein
MIVRIFCAAILLLLCGLTINAQSNSVPAFPPDSSPTPRKESSPLGSPEQELLTRALIRSEESAHKENLERAKEGAQLGVELRETFKSQKALNRDALKKLERLEKLARGIRSRAGGSDDDDILENPPRDIEAALARLADLSEALRKHVEKTSRHVVSAAVIDDSNEMIELIRFIRTLSQ